MASRRTRLCIGAAALVGGAVAFVAKYRREHVDRLRQRIAGGGVNRPPEALDAVDRADDASFPASDPPSYGPGL